MALILFEGFDNDPSTRLALIGSPTVGTGNGRYGTNSIQITNGKYIGIPIPPGAVPLDGTTVIYTGFAIYLTSIPTTDNHFLSHFEVSDANNGFVMGAGGQLKFRNSGTVRGTTSNLPQNQWVYVETAQIIHDTLGMCKVWFDGTLVMDVSNVDTRLSLQNEVSGLYLGTNSVSTGFRIDDLYVTTSTGPAPFNGRLGDVTVRRLTPDGTGAYAQGVGSDGNSVNNFELVDETAASASDFVELQSVGHKEAYTVPNLAGTDLPLAVRVSSWAGDGGGPLTIRNFLRIGGVDYNAAESLPVGLGFRWRDSTWTQNPATAAAWVAGGLNGAQLGIERTA